MTTKLIKECYAKEVKAEWKRLITDAYHRLEFDTTLHFLNKYLPKSGLILDAGGGPGRYTIELAKEGYDMVLLDFIPKNLKYAKRKIKKAKVKKRVKEIIEGTIIDLSQFTDNTFDAVLCTGGPLSHVLSNNDRTKAISELVRVAKPGAPIFVSVMGRLSVLVLIFSIGSHEIELPHFEPLRDSGDYFGGYGFTPCHFFLPEELREAFSIETVSVLEMVGLEGLSSQHPKELNILSKDKKRWGRWLTTHYQTCTHPSVVGLSGHMMIICQKK